MKIQPIVVKVAVGLLLIASAPALRAELLFDAFLIPSFDGNPNTEYSAWDVFYSPHGSANFPDFAAPNGTFQSASDAGFTPPANSNPTNPSAFWHNDNPTITQTDTDTAFIISPGISGNIYSFAAPTGFELEDSTPYTVGTVVLQFQTDGTLVDFDSIRLVYNVGSGDVSLPADEFIREYRNSGSAFGGTSNRNALQWNLTGLGITSYRLEWTATGSSMSLQSVSVDTAAAASSEVPEQRQWITGGAQTWGASSNWAEGSPSQTNGNVRMQNPSPLVVSDSSSRTVAELIFETASDVQIDQSATLTTNTGISTLAAATGTYTLNGNLQFGAYNLFDIEAGSVVIDGVVSGPYGFLKTGTGTATFTQNNTFGSGSGGVTVANGVVIFEGSNDYSGGTSVLEGDLVIQTDAPSGAPGALGNATSSINIGANSNSFSGIVAPARLLIAGDHTVGRGIGTAGGNFDHRIGATDTTAGAVVSGDVALGFNPADVNFFATGSTDRVTFTGAISGGGSGFDLGINPDGAAGTVVYEGTSKTYANRTVVQGGALELGPGVSLSGAVLIEPGGGSSQALLQGTGTVLGQVTVGSGGIIAPGSSPGSLTTGSQTWNSAGTLQVEFNDTDTGAGTGWDLLNVNGTLSVNSSSGAPFVIQVDTLDLINSTGPLNDFSSALSYSWKIVGTTGGITGFSADQFAIDTTGFVNHPGGGTFSLSLENSGNDLHLNFSPAPSPLNTWLQAEFTTTELADPAVSGDDADFDGDGLTTLEEYAFGGTAKAADTSSLRPGGRIDPDFGGGGEAYLTLTFTRLLDRTDINYVVRAGDSPDTLTTTVVEIIGGASPQTVNGGGLDAATPVGNTQEVTAADHERVQDAPRRFMTLDIERL